VRSSRKNIQELENSFVFTTSRAAFLGENQMKRVLLLGVQIVLFATCIPMFMLCA